VDEFFSGVVVAVLAGQGVFEEAGIDAFCGDHGGYNVCYGWDVGFL
jgi:hypothetical protein